MLAPPTPSPKVQPINICCPRQRTCSLNLEPMHWLNKSQSVEQNDSVQQISNLVQQILIGWTKYALPRPCLNIEQMYWFAILFNKYIGWTKHSNKSVQQMICLNKSVQQNHRLNKKCHWFNQIWFRFNKTAGIGWTKTKLLFNKNDSVEQNIG